MKRKPKYWPILDIPEGQIGEYEIHHRRFPAGHSFHTASARTALLAGHSGKDVAFNEPVRYHSLTYRGAVLMSDVPIEQAQADPIFKHYYGNVLVGGLGLGYAATRIALKRDVRRVVVVEIAAEVIELVAQHLPARAQRKIEVVHGDLLKYLKDTAAGAEYFDRAFYDTWVSDGEGTFFETVVPLLNASVSVTDHRPDCWNEDVMRGQLAFGLRSLVERLKAPIPGLVSPKLDELCKPTGSIFWDWFTRFFEWYRDNKDQIGEETLNKAIGTYAGNYGLWWFNHWWPEDALKE